MKNYKNHDSTKYSLYFYSFVAAHVFVWTLLPTIFRYDLALDSVEAIAWGHSWQLGYVKHPPISAWMAEGMMNIFPQQMWAIYFLAQICLALSFIATWELAKDFLPRQQAFMSILLLECIYYYNFTSTEFNANIALLPLWSFVTLYAWKVTKNPNSLKNWLIFAVFCALAMLTKYYAAMLFASIFLFFLHNKKLRKNLLTPAPYLFGATLILLLLPHIFWLIENDFVTFTYAKNRSNSDYHFYNHLLNPFLFFCSQALSLLLPSLVFWLASRGNKQEEPNNNEIKSNFLIFACFGPFFLTMIPSLLIGSGIKDMWGSVLWSWFGVGLFYFFPVKISPIFQKKFYLGFTLICAIAIIVFVDSQTSRLHKYGHFDGKLLVKKISEKQQPISFVYGDVWLTGNMNFFSNPRPHVVWDLRKLEKTGGIIFWNARHEGDDLPKHFTKEISAKIVTKEPIILPFIKFTDSPPYRVGWAVVTPNGN
ncbi:MAG: glycosyltransferase family 39 protein [Proteobacteria bacterium]|nr:glycosyltransferase family 39 protein [Pseudomonadota bacterium]